MERLNRLKAALAEAMRDKENNKNYIEDLLISIEYQETQVDKMHLYGLLKKELING